MHLEAFILIGGSSTRLGMDKAFARLGGETLAGRAARVVETYLAPRQMSFVTGHETQFDADLLTGLGHRVLADLKPGFGAWSGIYTSLTAAQSEWIFVLACDLPFVSAELLSLLAGLISDKTDAVVPVQADGRVQPLCAFYRVGPCLRAIADVFENSTDLPPVTTIFERVPARSVQFDEIAGLPSSEKFFLNVNTLEDLQFAEVTLARA